MKFLQSIFLLAAARTKQEKIVINGSFLISVRVDPGFYR